MLASILSVLSLSYCCNEMTITAPKQTSMLTSSMATIGSFKNKNAMIEIQNGLVCQKTMIKERGALVTARFRRKKSAYPEIILETSWYLCFQGKLLSGFIPARQHHIKAIVKMERFLKRVKSIT